LTLRGIGSSSTSIGIEQSVAVVIDDVYYGQGPASIEEGFFDLKELESERTAGSVSSQERAAGVISLTSRIPQGIRILTKVAYEFKVAHEQAEAIASRPLTDTLGLACGFARVCHGGRLLQQCGAGRDYTTLDVSKGLAATTHLAGPAAPQAPGEREFLGRVTLKWTPNDELTGRSAVQRLPTT